MTYPEALAWLYAAQVTGIKLGLDGMRRLLNAMGGQLQARFIHVAGTNGKGSVCAMIDAVCRAGGWRTGLYTSPHLITFRERIQLNGEMISERGVAEGLTRLRDLTAGWETAPTFFEYATALALDWFGRHQTEVIAWETGLGGRLDATNVIAPAACVITEIGLDHQAYLGDTLEAIAREKAGIIKTKTPVVVGRQPPEAMREIERAASAAGAPLIRAEAPFEGSVGLAGDHQRFNAALALAAVEAAGIANVDSSALGATKWPGRFQKIDRFILDGAHNPAAAARLGATWAEQFPDGARPTVILGILADKDAEGICQELGRFANRFLVAPVRSPRAAAPRSILAHLRAQALAIPAEEAESVASALAMAREIEGPALVTGSLFLVGEALALLTGESISETSWQ